MAPSLLDLSVAPGPSHLVLLVVLLRVSRAIQPRCRADSPSSARAAFLGDLCGRSVGRDRRHDRSDAHRKSTSKKTGDWAMDQAAWSEETAPHGRDSLQRSGPYRIPPRETSARSFRRLGQTLKRPLLALGVGPGLVEQRNDDRIDVRIQLLDGGCPGRPGASWWRRYGSRAWKAVCIDATVGPGSRLGGGLSCAARDSR